MTRAVETPVGRITPSGYGIARAAGAIHWYTLYEGPQMAFVDDVGNVFCLPFGMQREIQMTAQHPAWCLGHYVTNSNRKRTMEITRQAIVADLRARSRELYGVAA